ncbi:uncharacterized protein [Littorina saxatilis]|uniref:Uncharacterized protein n=1 Tax=Littorina saxatilis TaxID=31220 RepID=A0AAN9BZY0_9CAEN
MNTDQPWWLVLVVLSLWLAKEMVEAGLLEDKVKVMDKANVVSSKGEVLGPEPVYCIETDRSGVVTCDTNAVCCKADSPRIEGTDLCCPPGSHQYHFNSSSEVICACAV